MRQKNIFLYYIASLFTLLISLQPTASYAGLRLEQNRIIWQEGQAQQSMTLTNSNTDVYLVQTGVFPSPTGQKEVPEFVVIPPLFHLDSNSQQAMKILPQNSLDNLPKDRESIFYFSTLAIPGVSQELINSDAAQLSIGTRLVIKLFYRPTKLSYSSEIAIEKLKFSTSLNGLCIINDSPYFITLSNLSIKNMVINDAIGLMVSPYSQQKVSVSSRLEPNTKIDWQAINDYGGDTQVNSGSIIENKGGHVSSKKFMGFLLYYQC